MFERALLGKGGHQAAENRIVGLKITNRSQPLTDLPSATPRQVEQGIRHRLFWGFGAQGFALLLRIAQQIALVPILIGAWGAELYADWIIVFSAATSLSLLDLGIQTYFGNAMLIARSKGNIGAYRRQFGIAMSAYMVILALAGILLVTGSLSMSWQSMITTHVMAGDAVNLTFLTLAAATLVLIPFGIVTAVYRVFGDYAHASVITTLADALRGVAICTVSLIGMGPASAAGIYLMIAVLFWLGVVVDQRRRYGETPFALTIPTRAELRDGAVGSSMYLAPTLATPLVLNGPILLLGAMGAGPDGILAFSVCRTLTGFVRQLVHQLCHPIGAELARQQATNDMHRLRLVFAGAGRLLSGIAGLLSGLTVVLAGPFLGIWTQNQVVYDPWLVGFFLFSVVATAPSQVALMLFYYNNQPRVLVVTYAVYAALTLTLCLALISSFSATGAAAAVGIAEVLSIGLLLPRAALGSIALSLTPYVLRCAAIAVLGLALGWALAWVLATLYTPNTLLRLTALSVMWSLLIAPPAFYLLLARMEREWLKGLLSRNVVARQDPPQGA